MRQIGFFIRKLNDFAGMRLYINLFGMTLVSFIDSIGILLLIPLLSLTGLIHENNKMTFSVPWISNHLPQFNQRYSLILILGIYFVIMIGQNIFQRSQRILNSQIQQGFLRYLKEETYKEILNTKWRFFLQKRKTDLINALTTDIGRIGRGVFLVLQATSSLIFTIVQIALAFCISIKMTLFVLLFGVILLFFSRHFIKKSHTLGQETVSLSRLYLGGVTDHLNGIKDIKSNSIEASHINWFEDMCKSIELNIINITRLKSLSQLMYKSASSLLIISFIYLTITFFRTQPAQVLLIIAIFSRLWPRFTTLQSNLEQIGTLIPSFNTIMGLQKECKEEREGTTVSLRKADIKPLVVAHSINCIDVSFRYSNQSVYALQDIHLHIPAKQMTAIVGRSGAGKSTLIDILMGLITPDKGQITIDGKGLTSEKVVALRKSLSYVPQDPFLFNASIRDNLQVVKKEASEGQLWEALEFAAADEFVRLLPDGIDTVIGDRGVRLSGGERQRLVIARAVLRKPTILILDEATSSLDSENEARIQRVLENLRGSMTVIVIAHRLSTIRNADQVVVLNQGRIVQNGEFSQLASDKGGMFSHLLDQQVTLPAHNKRSI